MRQKISRRTLFKYIGSKFGLQHQHQRLAVVGRDCTRRCRQCLCPRAAGAEEGRWPRSVRAFNISLGRTLLFKAAHFAPAPQGLSRVEGLCRPGAGRCCNRGFKRQTGRAHCVTADASANHPNRVHAPHVVQKCDISRSAPGAHKPKLQQGQVAFGHSKAQHFMLQ